MFATAAVSLRYRPCDFVTPSDACPNDMIGARWPKTFTKLLGISVQRQGRSPIAFFGGSMRVLCFVLLLLQLGCMKGFESLPPEQPTASSILSSGPMASSNLINQTIPSGGSVTTYSAQYRSYTFGTLNRNSSEFAGGDEIVNVMSAQTNASDFKQWIGYSTCPTCPTVPQYQKLVLGDLVLGNVYELEIYPWNVATPANRQDPSVPAGINYEVLVAAGAVDFLDGTNVKSMHPYDINNSETVWKIRFVARTNVLHLAIGAQDVRSPTYLYIDQYRFRENGPFRAPEISGRYLTFASLYGDGSNFYQLHGVAYLRPDGVALVNFYFVDTNEARSRYAQPSGISVPNSCGTGITQLYLPPHTSFFNAYQTTWTRTGFNSFVLSLLDVGFAWTTDEDDTTHLKDGILFNSDGYGFLTSYDPTQIGPINYMQIPNLEDRRGSYSDYSASLSLIHGATGFNPAAFPATNDIAQAPCPGFNVYAFNQQNPMSYNLAYQQTGGHTSWVYLIRNPSGVVDRALIIENSTKNLGAVPEMFEGVPKFYVGVNRLRHLQ